MPQGPNTTTEKTERDYIKRLMGDERSARKQGDSKMAEVYHSKRKAVARNLETNIMHYPDRTKRRGAKRR